MLEQLSNNKSLEKFRKEIEEIADLFEKEISFENILSNDIKESIDRKSIEENKGEVSGGFSTRFLILTVRNQKEKMKKKIIVNPALDRAYNDHGMYLRHRIRKKRFCAY